MTPDIRPISMLGIPSVVATWETYMLLPERRVETFRYIKPYTEPSPVLCTIPPTYPITAPVPYSLLGNARSECYPCEPLPPFTPLPWPVLPGDEEIEEWRGHSDERLEPARIKAYWKGGTGWMWQLESKRKHRPVSELQRIHERPDFHPAPRKSKTGPVWVWEADR